MEQDVHCPQSIDRFLQAETQSLVDNGFLQNHLARPLICSHFIRRSPVCLSVCLSVCLFVHLFRTGFWFEYKNAKKTNVFQGKSNSCAGPDFKFKRSNVKVIGRQKSVYYKPASSGASGDSRADCKLNLTTVEPTLLSALKILGNWTDGTKRRHYVNCNNLFIIHSFAL